MISYGDFEFAIRRWRARAAGLAEPVPESGPTTVAEGVEAQEESMSAPATYSGTIDSDPGAGARQEQQTRSGSIVVDDSLIDGSGPIAR